MNQTKVNDLQAYFQQVQQTGKLRSEVHARRWSTAILKTLGFHLDKSTQKALAAALPEELAAALTRVFWLLHFRNPNLTRREFLDNVARRSGNTDVAFALYPTTAVFSALKGMISSQLNEQVSQSLSPEVRELWQQA